MDCLVYLGIHICCPDWNCCRFLVLPLKPQIRFSGYRRGWGVLSVFAFDLRIGLWEAAGICLVLLNVLVLSLPKKSTKAVKP